MIKSLKAHGLNGALSFDLKFHEDINIITGKNGSGKTTVLKLLWYVISGNLERINCDLLPCSPGWSPRSSSTRGSRWDAP